MSYILRGMPSSYWLSRNDHGVLSMSTFLLSAALLSRVHQPTPGTGGPLHAHCWLDIPLRGAAAKRRGAAYDRRELGPLTSSSLWGKVDIL